MAADPFTSSTVGELLSFDISDDDDPFADFPRPKTRDDRAILSPRSAKRKADDDKENLGLGLDEEVKITKKRQPVAKLDETRLLSQPGIPKLRAVASSGQLNKKLRLKGRGHEFTDAARLLNYYQLWLDNLYPRAKFADGLQLVEKVGHSKSMQRLRREWIDESKPGYLREREMKKTRDKEDALNERVDKGAKRDIAGVDENRETTTETRRANEPNKSIFESNLSNEDMFFPDSNSTKSLDGDDAPDDDELEVLLAEISSRPEPKPAPMDPDSEGEDDLDALLAEQESRRNPIGRPAIVAKAKNILEQKINNDKDDLDALLAEEGFRSATVVVSDRHEDTDTGRGLSDSYKKITKPHRGILYSSPMSNNDIEDDELDALLAEQEVREMHPLSSAQEVATETGIGGLSTGEDSQGRESGLLFSSSPIPNDNIPEL